jgi:hypothetical protein
MMEHEITYILLIFVCEILFGILLNWGIGEARRLGYLEGFTWLAVVIAAAAVLIGLLLVDWKAAVIVLGLFVCVGVPLIGGDIWRYMQARRASQKEIIEEVERE